MTTHDRTSLSRTAPPPGVSARSALGIVAVCWLASCAAPRTSPGLIDMDGVATPVVVQNIEADQRTTALHLQKIDSSRKTHQLAAANHATVRSLHESGRIGATEFHASELEALRTQIDVVDAQLALADTQLLPDDQASFLDSDGDGLPDMVYQSPAAAELRAAKLALCEQAASQSEQALTQIQRLHKAGRASTAQLQTATLQVRAAERALLAVRREQH